MALKTLIVGWNEIGELPELEIYELPMKIDTGAKTSSLHATGIEMFTKNHQQWVKFKTKNSKGQIISIEKEIFDQREVTSSNGQTQSRFVIKTPICLGGQTWDIELTLTNREKMRFSMLLGRRAMKNIQVSPMEENLLS